MNFKRLSLALLWVMLSATVASAAPPVDGDGDYLFAGLTKPVRMAWPNPIQSPTNMIGWSSDDQGGVELFAIDDSLKWDANGVLTRRTMEDISSMVFLYGHALTVPDGLVFCDMHKRLLRRLRPDGGVETINVPGLSLEGPCSVVSDGKGGVVISQLQPMVFWRLSTKFKIVAEGISNFDAIRKPGQGMVVCGTDPKGQPLGLASDHDGHQVALVRLDGALQPQKTLWGLSYDQSPFGKAIEVTRPVTARGCGIRGERVFLAFSNHIMLFEGQKLVSALRGGQPLSDKSGSISNPIGPYGLRGMNMFRLLGKDGRALITAQGTSGEVKFFVHRSLWPADQASARAAAEQAAKRGDHLRAHVSWLKALEGQKPGAGAALHLGKVQNMLAAGWWEMVIEDGALLEDEAAQWKAKERKRLDELVSEARAHTFARWSVRDMSGGLGVMPTAFVDAGKRYLDKSLEMAKAHPGNPVLHYGAARVAARHGQQAVYLDQLQQLHKAIVARKESPSRYPELFDVFAAQGDIKSMETMIKGLGAKADKTLKARWQASLWRARGKVDKALAALGRFEPKEPAATSMLRARLLVEAGKVDDGIIAWTRLSSGNHKADPNVHAGLGVAYMRRGLGELAVEAFLQAHNFDPDNPIHLSNLAAAYALMDKRQDALKQVFTALGKNPDDPLLRHQLDTLSKPPEPAKKDGAKEAAIAVLPLGTAGGATERLGLGQMMADMTTTALVSKHKATVVERGRLDEIMAEQKLHASAHIDKATVVKLGKLLGARRMIVGNVAEFKDTVRIDLRLVDVESGKVLAAAGKQVALEPDALAKALELLTAELMRNN